MSNLDTILAQLKQSLTNQVPPITQVKSDDLAYSEDASKALKEFLNNVKPISCSSNSELEKDVKSSDLSRKALSEFVGSPLGKSGPPSAPGVIVGNARALDSENKKLADDSALAKKEIADKQVAQAAASNLSKVISSAASASATNTGTGSGAVQQSSIISKVICSKCSLDAHFEAKKANVISVDRSTVALTKSAKPFPWIKYVQSIESALRIGDTHFAESLLTILNDAAESLSVDMAMFARLKSLQARMLMEKKQLTDAQIQLIEMLRAIDESEDGKSLGAAYCWLALAQCYHYQKKFDKAETAKAKAILLADAKLGSKDPEAQLFRGPLLS